jgi:hypothetical protein
MFKSMQIDSANGANNNCDLNNMVFILDNNYK